jgi:protoporphyrinogen/coproporphyrinogen III oxidase
VTDVLIVGGGISGLAAAYYLGQQNLSVVLVEAQDRLGGLIATEQRNGCYLEAGPDSYIATKPAVRELAQSIPGLADRIIGSNDTARRVFVAREGRLEPMPRGMAMMVPGEWLPALESPLFPAATKLRFLSELCSRPRAREQDISISEFVKDHFDETVLEYITEPLLTAVYGGEAGKLSARSVLPRFVGYEEKYGSLIRGVRRERAQRKQEGGESEPMFQSFENGMQTLVDAIAGALGSGVRIVRGVVERAAPAPGGGWKVVVGGQSEEAAHLVLACPAFRAAAVIEEADAGLSEELAAIPYSSAVTVMMGYEGAQLNHPMDGFGFLVPKRERKSISACTWVNTKFPSRVGSGWAVLRAFIVGREADDLMAAGDEELSGIVAAELNRFMGTCARAWFTTIHRWPRSMPQYVVGHQARTGRIEKRLSEHKGLHLVGNAYDGVGIPDCVRLARSVSQVIAAQVREIRDARS